MSKDVHSLIKEYNNQKRRDEGDKKEVTCIIAVVQDEITYFGADSWVGTMPNYQHDQVTQTIRKEPKIFKRNGMLIGMNGNTRVIQVIKYLFDVPEYKHGTDKIAYLVRDFIEEMKKALKKAECETVELEGGILLEIENELFTIGNDFRVCNTAYSYDAIGKAKYIALGSLDTTGSKHEYMAVFEVKPRNSTRNQGIIHEVD